MKLVNACFFRVVAIFLVFPIFENNSLLKSRQPSPCSENVIFFIADGMGLAALTSARVWAKSSAGKLSS